MNCIRAEQNYCIMSSNICSKSSEYGENETENPVIMSHIHLCFIECIWL